MPRKKYDSLSIGPGFKYVPHKDFSEIEVSEKMLLGMWNIVGPSVNQNSRQGRMLWEIISLAYMEGLSHGHAMAEKHITRNPLPALYK